MRPTRRFFFPRGGTPLHACRVLSLATASWTVTASVEKARRGATQPARAPEVGNRPLLQPAGEIRFSRDAINAPQVGESAARPKSVEK